MKIRIILLIIVVISAVLSCGTFNPTKKLVKNYLAEYSGLDASSIGITEISDPIAWHAADSLVILQEEFEAQKNELMGHLQATLEAAKKAIQEAEKVKEGGYSMLSDMAEETIKDAEFQIKMAELYIDGINSDCKDTPLEPHYLKILDYQSRKDEFLFNRITGKWNHKGTEQAFNLMANTDLTSIIGTLPE